MTGQLFEDIPTDAEVDADLREREDDPTPRGVVRAILDAVAQNTDTFAWMLPALVLDVCAGSGCWASELRRRSVAGRVHITGLEIDERKREHLLKWCDKVIIGDEREHALDHYEIAVGNPYFSGLVHEDPEQSMPARLLRLAGAVLLFHQAQSFTRSRAGAALVAAHPPTAIFNVPGSVRFRNGINPSNGKAYGADSRCYQATLWKRGHEGPAETFWLPWLTPAQRRWSVIPGTEEPNEDLPAAPNWKAA